MIAIINCMAMICPPLVTVRAGWLQPRWAPGVGTNAPPGMRWTAPTAPGTPSRTEKGARRLRRGTFEAGPCKNGSQQTMVGPIITWRHLRYRRDAMGRGMVTA